MSKKKNRKVIPYNKKKPLNINVGTIVFAIIFLYLLFSVSTYMRRNKIQFYEVVAGGIVNDKLYTGIVLRDEQVYNTEHSGHINYYLREGKRASVGTRIYSLDETGQLEQLLKDAGNDGQVLPEENLADLKKQLSSYVLSMENQNFSTIYDTRYSLEASVLEYSSFNTLDQLDQLATDSGAIFDQVSAPASGVVSYGFDSFEGLQPADIEASSFDKSSYTKTFAKSGALVDSGSPAYKLVTSENWSIVFPLSDEDQALYADKTSLLVHFRDYSLSTSAAYSSFTGKDGKNYGKLDFGKYMAQFIMDRYVEFEIEQTQAQGLKIPVSSVTEKNFYLIPISYMTQGGDSSDTGFLKETYSDAGTSVVFVPTDIYYKDDTNYYIDMNTENGFKAGDYVVRPDESSERYQLGSTASLKGVYNINKGYTVFKQIEIMDSNSEYYTVRKSMDYGLSVYDHIVLDAASVTEGQLLYQ